MKYFVACCLLGVKVELYRSKLGKPLALVVEGARIRSVANVAMPVGATCIRSKGIVMGRRDDEVALADTVIGCDVLRLGTERTVLAHCISPCWLHCG